MDPEELLATVLDAVAQPIWVVDPAGVIRFANPAALTALGYDAPEELLGRPSHQTIHYRRPDGRPYPAAECPMLLPRMTGERVTSALDWFLRRDGSMFPVSYISAPIEMPEGRGAVVAFTDIEARRRAERELRERSESLAAERASQRRIAALVARAVPADELLAAVARELAQLLDADATYLARYEAGGMASLVATWSTGGLREVPLGTPLRTEGDNVCSLVRETRRPARMDDFDGARGPIAAKLRELGVRSSVGAPIVVDGRLWGVAVAASRRPVPLAPDLETRIAGFAELAATGIANAEARADARHLADEQAALRRVATLVARESGSDEVFHAVAEEVKQLLGTEAVGMLRFDPDGAATLVAQSTTPWDPIALGTQFAMDGTNIVSEVLRTGRSSRTTDWTAASGPPAVMARTLGLRSSVATPINVDGRLWGTLVVVTREAELPQHTESWLQEFTELVATAISNIQARTELAASRARIVAAADKERRQVVRDLHDGAQQRLVHTVITLKLAASALEAGEDAAPLVTEALDHAHRATHELRELAHGIVPSVLAQGGLSAGVRALASRMPMRIDVDVAVGRLPAPVEATAYFIVAEALTNVVKHARATRASISARMRDDSLDLEITDDGVGGASPQGSGLVGLADRVAALDGTLMLGCPPDGGTTVTAVIPVAEATPPPPAVVEQARPIPIAYHGSARID